MFRSLSIATRLHRRKRTKILDEIQLALLRQIIRLNLFLSQMQARLAPTREYLWLPAVAFLFGMVIGLVVTTVG